MPLVERDDLLLRIGQARVGADYQRGLRVPVSVLVRVDVAVPGIADAGDAGEQEALGAAVGEAPSPRLPAGAVEGEGVRRHPVPARGKIGERLVFDLDGLVVADSLNHGTQVAGVDAAHEAGDRIEGRQLADPGFLLRTQSSNPDT